MKTHVRMFLLCRIRLETLSRSDRMGQTQIHEHRGTRIFSPSFSQTRRLPRQRVLPQQQPWLDHGSCVLDERMSDPCGKAFAIRTHLAGLQARRRVCAGARVRYADTADVLRRVRGRNDSCSKEGGDEDNFVEDLHCARGGS